VGAAGGGSRFGIPVLGIDQPQTPEGGIQAEGEGHVSIAMKKATFLQW